MTTRPTDEEMDRCERMLTGCTCSSAYSDRGLTDPNCMACQLGSEVIDTFKAMRAELTERQAARDGVTDEMVEIALNAPVEGDNVVRDYFPGRYTDDLVLMIMRAALESIAQHHAPIDMVLYCPVCHAQHIDAPDNDISAHPDGSESRWTNPPHRSHLCHQCGTIWRPADVPTNGVKEIKTRGTKDRLSAQPLGVFDREYLGQQVREVWIAWAKEQSNPKASWLVTWEGLSEPDREVDRRIGEHIAMLSTLRQPQQMVPYMKLDKPARIGAATFGVGVPWSTVIGCAQRAYEAKPISEETAKEMRALISMFNYPPEHNGDKPEPWNSTALAYNGKKEG